MAARTTRAATRAAAANSLADEVAAPDRKQQQQQQLSSPPATPPPGKRPSARRAKPAGPTKASKARLPKGEPPKKVEQRKRKRGAAPKVPEDINELPHNLGRLPSAGNVEIKPDEEEPEVKRPKSEAAVDGTAASGVPSPRRSARKPAKVKDEAAKIKAELDDPAVVAAINGLTDPVPPESPEAGKKKRKKNAKANPYGLTPGISPFPDWSHPTPEECQEVNDLLTKEHGEVKAPATIPAPSATVSGCGEVPSILDALIRTLLSAATTGTNSSMAFQGLVKTFGLLDGGVGKGSVDWERVRRADVKEVFQAIKSGGLAATKSKRIKEILDMVYEENMARRDALVKAKEDKDDPGPAGAENETEAEKAREIARANQHVLSLDHLHALGSDDALNELIRYPGIGPKTASCVLLFCMQRPSFAVDTHVFRLCRWLDWVPEKATRNSAYSHCEVRVPDGLKYPLHQLMIRHGKTCPRCRAATSVGGEGWDKGCPIEHLVKRTGKRKTGPPRPPKSGKKGRNKKAGDADGDDSADESDASSELSDIDTPKSDKKGRAEKAGDADADDAADESDASSELSDIDTPSGDEPDGQHRSNGAQDGAE